MGSTATGCREKLSAASVWHAAPHLASCACGGLLAKVAGVNLPGDVIMRGLLVRSCVMPVRAARRGEIGAAFHAEGSRPRKMRQLCSMDVQLQIPDDVARVIQNEQPDLSRAALEALALEGYRSERLSEGQVRRMLGFRTRMRVHTFLKAHNVYLNYSIRELENDLPRSSTLKRP
jgi:hypothetical protein